MPETVLRTKLYVPPLRPNLVPRSRLIERLNQGLQFRHKLTLISAPAGFGKTTLASEWVNQKGEGRGQKGEGRGRKDDLGETSDHSSFTSHSSKVAWLSLDEGDNDPTRFLTYFVAALQTLALGEVEGIESNFGEGVLGMLQSPEPPPTESILTALLNEISTVPDDFILVLDDYHLIDARSVDASTSVDDALTFLLEHLPPQMHLVIATREDPLLPLARLRVRSQLTELRVRDLRFTLSEAAGFLNQLMGLNLSTEEIAALETRTEGWIAGLQMAALSMQGREDSASFIRAFTGSHRFVMDYLVEEILQQQPERMRSFLLKTSILNSLSGPLCDAITGQEDGRRMLATLERDNLFIVPLDDERQWYRYHHLFADVLHAHSMEEQPNEAAALHQRASEWYEQNGLTADAVRHAFAAKDFERAARLVEQAMPAMDWSFQSVTWLGWVKGLPDELVRARPVLSVGYAMALLEVGELEAVEVRLRDAEWWLEAAVDMNDRLGSEMVVMDEEQYRSLPGKIATTRAYRAQALGDVPGAVRYARQALDLLPENDYFERGRAAAFLGVACWASGELETAHWAFAEFMTNMRMAGNILVAISGTFLLADIRMAQGRLRDAAKPYEQSLQLATAQGEPVMQGTADLYVGWGELLCEQGDLEAAGQQLQTSIELGEQAALPELRYRSCVGMARINAAQGNLDDALNLLQEAERLAFNITVPDVRPAAALKTRLWVAQGRLAEALSWAREQDLSFDDDLSYLREFEHITLARVLIALYKKRDGVEGAIHEAVGLLACLLKSAEEGGRMGSVIEILLLQALAHQAQGDMPPALESLERALMLAEPEGYVQIFVDEGASMATLLREAAKNGTAPNYVGQLQAAFGQAEDRSAVNEHLIAQRSVVVDPLSPREIDVLLLVAQGLTNRQISERLFLALDTVKGHNRRIYEKLGVKNRTQAVNKARSLGMIPYQ